MTRRKTRHDQAAHCHDQPMMELRPSARTTHRSVESDGAVRA